MSHCAVAVNLYQNHSSAALKEGSYDMPALPSILVYGRDASLLDTRSWVLERAGYRVLTALSLVEAERIAAVEPISLFLLCHSLSVEDCENALTAASTIQPEMKRLLMTANTPLPSLDPNDRVISAFDGPKKLVAAVHGLVPKSTN